MVTTRTGDHTNDAGADANGKSEAPAAVAAAGEKHSIEPDSASASPDAKRVKKSDDGGARQTTLEETLEKQDGQESNKVEEGGGAPDIEMKDQEEKRAAEPEQAAEPEKGQDDEELKKADEVQDGQESEMAEESEMVEESEKVEESKKVEEGREAPDVEMKDQEEKRAAETEPAAETQEPKDEPQTEEEPQAGEAVAKNGDGETVEMEEKAEVAEKPKTEEAAANGDGETAELPHEDKKVPSNILEKGIVYFFFRARVNTDQPEEVDDIARSYIILRPIGTDSKLGEGPIGDAGNTRLLALPKKVLPESGRDRFMVFVEKSGASFADLKEQFLTGADKETKSGTSHHPAATPAGEGVYIITTTGRESHLAYMLTLPSNLGEVQKDLGLKEQGSFILSTKNPKFPGPANATLPEAPDFSQEIKEEFRDLRWMPSKPEHLDFVNAQILMIGESSGIKKAVEPRKKDIKEGNEEPKEVLEEIEEEDTKRMEELGEDDSGAIFADLQARAKDYPKLQTTF